MKIVSVTWVDAVFQLDPTESFRPLVADTTGFLVEDLPTHVTIAGERFEDGTYRALTVIPRECVRKVKPLK